MYIYGFHATQPFWIYKQLSHPVCQDVPVYIFIYKAYISYIDICKYISWS